MSRLALALAIFLSLLLSYVLGYYIASNTGTIGALNKQLKEALSYQKDQHYTIGLKDAEISDLKQTIKELTK